MALPIDREEPLPLPSGRLLRPSRALYASVASVIWRNHLQQPRVKSEMRISTLVCFPSYDELKQCGNSFTRQFQKNGLQSCYCILLLFRNRFELASECGGNRAKGTDKQRNTTNRPSAVDAVARCTADCFAYRLVSLNNERIGLKLAIKQSAAAPQSRRRRQHHRQLLAERRTSDRRSVNTTVPLGLRLRDK